MGDHNKQVVKEFRWKAASSCHPRRRRIRLTLTRNNTTLCQSSVIHQHSRFSLLQSWSYNKAADRPAWCSASGPLCCTQMSMVSVTNWWPRLSQVYHTDRPHKLTTPETISRSRDIDGAR